MMTHAQALGDIRYDKVKLTSKPKVKTAYDPPMWVKSRDSRYIGCLIERIQKGRVLLTYVVMFIYMATQVGWAGKEIE